MEDDLENKQDQQDTIDDTPELANLATTIQLNMPKGFYNVKGAMVYNTTTKVVKHPPNQPTTAAASTQSDPRPK